MVNRRATLIKFILYRLALNLSEGRHHVQSKWMPVTGSWLVIKPKGMAIFIYFSACN